MCGTRDVSRPGCGSTIGQRRETADEVTDNAKRLFFEQRLKSANDTKADAARWEKERKEEDAAFRELQKKRKTKAKSFHAASTKSRQALATSRMNEPVLPTTVAIHRAAKTRSRRGAKAPSAEGAGAGTARRRRSCTRCPRATPAAGPSSS